MQVTHESRSAIARSHIFLRLAVECPADKRIEFEAFLEAAIIFARAALHRFKADNSNHPQWNYWWASLRGNPSFEFFRTERDWLLKEASPKLGSERSLRASAALQLATNQVRRVSSTFSNVLMCLRRTLSRGIFKRLLKCWSVRRPPLSKTSGCVDAELSHTQLGRNQFASKA